MPDPDKERAAQPGILVVDDNRDYAQLLQRFLESRGYTVRVARCADEALASFDEMRPSLVLLDLMMPGVDGRDICRALKAHAEHGSRVRVILLTGLSEAGAAQAAEEACVDDYATKPIELQELLARVERNMALVANA